LKPVIDQFLGHGVGERYVQFERHLDFFAVLVQFYFAVLVRLVIAARDALDVRHLGAVGDLA
jgi:hypothetical protein